MHQVQSIDTVDNISVNRQRQVPRTGTAQWQDLGDVSCDATQVPMIQKAQKTFEILKVQFIDKVVEISEIMQSKDKCQRSRRNGNSRKFADRIVDVPVVLKTQCQPNAQVLEYMDICHDNLVALIPLAVQRLMDVYKRHLVLMVLVGLFVPKQRLMLHLTHRALFSGIPRGTPNGATKDTTEI